MPDLTQAKAAAEMGISPDWLRKLAKRGIVTRNADKTYPDPQSREEYAAFKQSSKKKRHAGFGNGLYESARAKKTAMQARLLELELAEREGSLILVEHHRESIGTICDHVRSAILSLPSQAAKVLQLKTMPEAQQALVRLSEGLLDQILLVADVLDRQEGEEPPDRPT